MRRRWRLSASWLAGLALLSAGCDPDASNATGAASEGAGETAPEEEAADGADTAARPPRPAPATDPEPPAEDPVAHRLWELGQAHGELLEWHDPEPTRDELEAGGTRDLQLVLLDGRCYRTVAAGGPGIEELDLLLFDPNGVLMREDATRGPQAVLGDAHPVCIDESGAYRLRVRATEGAGTFAVRTLRSRI
jgi:hypothetical protein